MFRFFFVQFLGGDGQDGFAGTSKDILEEGGLWNQQHWRDGGTWLAARPLMRLKMNLRPPTRRPEE